MAKRSSVSDQPPKLVLKYPAQLHLAAKLQGLHLVTVETPGLLVQAAVSPEVLRQISEAAFAALRNGWKPPGDRRCKRERERRDARRSR